MSQRSLLLIAHGSRRPDANREVQRLTEQLGEELKDQFGLSLCAFLELAEPSIPAGLQELIDHGANDIVILPYFLASGNHVANDIPAIVAAKQANHPSVNIHIKPYLGARSELIGLLARSARD